MSLLKITTVEGRSSVEAVGYLGSKWGQYQLACTAAAAKWNRQRGDSSRNVCPSDSLPSLVSSLKGAGFDVELCDASKAILEGAAATGLTPAEEVASRHVEAMEAEYRTRGLSLWKPFQTDGAIFLAARRRALLGDEMGTGKTIQLLTALPVNAAAMVLCPASVVINWAREARKWRPDLIAIVVMKNPSRRTEDALDAEGIRVATECAWPMPGSITVVNYESAPCASDVYESVNAFDHATGGMVSVRTLRIERTLEGDPVVGTVLIGDELHRCKNHKARMTAKWQTLRAAIVAAGGSTYGATGTPIYNKPTDLAQILKNLNCFDDVFISWNDFKFRTGGFDNQWGTDWTGVIDPSVAQSLRRVMIRREKKDVMKSLPPKTYKDVYVEPSEALRKALDEIEKRLKGTKLDAEMARLRELQAMLQSQPDDYQELASEYEGLRGSALNSMKNSIPFEDMSRVHAMMSEVGYAGAVDMIEDYEEAKEPIVVFCPHRAPVERLGQRDGWRTILGGEDKADRDQTVTYFQAGGCLGVAATIKAGGIGITLNRAKTVIFLGLDWSPAENWQAEDRVHRGEQRAHVLVVRIMPNHTFVRRLMELITIKTQTHEDAISAASVVGEMADERKEAAQKALSALKAEQEMADMADAARSSGPAASVPVGHLLDLIPAGRYALDSVPDATGATHTVFWQLDKPEAGRWARWAFLKVQRGPETGRFSTIRPDRMATAKCASVLERLAKDPRTAAIRYGQEIGECAICGRALTEEGSREAGIGPICAKKVGW